jgi:hypothetical protein
VDDRAAEGVVGTDRRGGGAGGREASLDGGDEVVPVVGLGQDDEPGVRRDDHVLPETLVAGRQDDGHGMRLALQPGEDLETVDAPELRVHHQHGRAARARLPEGRPAVRAGDDLASGVLEKPVRDPRAPGIRVGEKDRTGEGVPKGASRPRGEPHHVRHGQGFLSERALSSGNRGHRTSSVSEGSGSRLKW